MFKVGIGQAEDIDTLRAVNVAVTRCKKQMGEYIPQAGIVFAGIEFDHPQMLAEIYRNFPGIELVGCTTAGEISSDFGFSDDSINLMVLYSDTLEFKAGVGFEASADPDAAVKTALEQARQGLSKKESLCLVFPDWQTGSANDVVDSLNAALGPHCPVFGGISGQQWASEKPPLQFYQEEILQDAVPLLLLAGNVDYGFSVSNSWEPVGVRAMVTEAQALEVMRIGDMKALDFYRHYLGEHTSPAYELPLAVYEDDGTHFYIRTPVNYDEEKGSVFFSGKIPQGSMVQLTEATRDRVVEDTKASVERVANDYLEKGRPSATLVFSCAARKMILGSRIREELEILQNSLPSHLPIMGFYAYGEVSPLKRKHHSRLHNCTMVTLVIGEKEGQLPTELGTDYQASQETLWLPRSSQVEQLKAENLFLRKKLGRMSAYLERLEYYKDLNSVLLRKINREINAARMEIQTKNELLLETLTLADEVQHNLLPQRNPSIEKFDIAGRSIYCSKTGGDYYDFLDVSGDYQGRFSIVVGDVSGHGIEAALLMTTARALIRSRASQPGSISEIVSEVNHHLTQDLRGSGRFMSLFYLTIDPTIGSLQWVRAGHDAAILFNPVTDSFEELRGPGMVLGVEENLDYRENEKPGLAKGQIIFLGTDGIWEAHNKHGKMFGKSPIYQIVRQNADAKAEEILDEIIAALTRFLGDHSPEDDVTLVVVKVKSDLD